MKKLLAIFLAVLMLLFVGCSKKPDDGVADTTADKETEAQTTDAESRDKEVRDYFDALSEDYTVKDMTDEQFIAVYTVPDFYELSKLIPEGDSFEAYDLIDLAKENPDTVKTLEITVKRDEDATLKDKMYDTMFFEIFCNIIGSVEVDLSDPAERTEASDENN